MQIGYARVSTDDQDNAAQVAALKTAGCERIYKEKDSGGRWDRGPNFTGCSTNFAKAMCWRSGNSTGCLARSATYSRLWNGSGTQERASAA